MSQNWVKLCILGGQYGLARYADIHDDEELRLLQRSLPYVVMHGVAGSTFNKYKSAWDKWLRWSDTKHISGQPWELYYVAIYFNHLLFVHHNRRCLTAAFYGVRWGRHIVGLESPTENPLVKLAYEGAVRMCAGPRGKKDPISVEIIKDLVEKYCTKNADGPTVYNRLFNRFRRVFENRRTAPHTTKTRHNTRGSHANIFATR